MKNVWTKISRFFTKLLQNTTVTVC
jgi:hypothetical protein